MYANQSRNCSDAWYARESSDQNCVERLTELKELLVLLEKRWKVAGEFQVSVDYTCTLHRTLTKDLLGEYLRIVEATEFHLSSAIAV